MAAHKKLVRDRFRTLVFARDRHRCAFCERTDELDAHHVTDRHELPHGGYVVENGITLCPEHHQLAEVFHRTGVAAPGFHPNDLYERISSSYQIALKAAENLR